MKLSFLKYTIPCFLVYLQGYMNSFWFRLVPEHFLCPIRNAVPLRVTPHPPALGSHSPNCLYGFAFSGHHAPREPFPVWPSVSGFSQFSRKSLPIHSFLSDRQIPTHHLVPLSGSRMVGFKPKLCLFMCLTLKPDSAPKRKALYPVFL